MYYLDNIGRLAPAQNQYKAACLITEYIHWVLYAGDGNKLTACGAQYVYMTTISGCVYIGYVETTKYHPDGEWLQGLCN